MHVALNPASDYDGGRLVFASPIDGFIVPDRLQGGAVIHDHTHVHGVTALARGTRYSLFLCDTLEEVTKRHLPGMTLASTLALAWALAWAWAWALDNSPAMSQTQEVEVDLRYLVAPARDQLAFFERALRFLDQVDDDDLRELAE